MIFVLEDSVTLIVEEIKISALLESTFLLVRVDIVGKKVFQEYLSVSEIQQMTW